MVESQGCLYPFAFAAATQIISGPGTSSASQPDPGHKAETDKDKLPKEKKRRVDSSKPPPEPEKPPPWVTRPDLHPQEAETKMLLFAKAKPAKASPSRTFGEEPSGSARHAASQDRCQQFKGEVYGSWTHKESELGNRPRALHLYSGPQRKNDLAHYLTAAGWAVCSVDLEQPHPTDLRDRMIQEHIINDVLNSKYDYIHLGTPCNTYSALREIPPGPRPLRSSDEIMGISEGLTQKEKEDLKEGNLHTEFSGRVMDSSVVSLTPFSLENPEPQNEVTIFNTPVMAPFMKRKET